MKIDSHQHFWRYNPARDRWITDEMAVLKRNFLPDELNRELDASGIDGSIAVQADQSEDETLFLLDLAKRYDTIAGVVGWVNLCAHNLSELLSFSRNVRSCADFGISYRQNRTIVSCCESTSFGEWRVYSKFDFIYDILIYPKQLLAAIKLVEKFPQQRFVIDHMAKPPIKTKETAALARHLRNIAEVPNVLCKLSGLLTEADWVHWVAEDFRPYLDIVFEAFGPDRLMFGAVCLLAARMGKRTG